MLRFGDSTIGLHILGELDQEGPSPHAGLSFQVDDLDAAIDKLKASGGQHIITREPTNFVPVRMCEVRDTEGNGIEIRQHVSNEPDLTDPKND